MLPRITTRRGYSCIPNRRRIIKTATVNSTSGNITMGHQRWLHWQQQQPYSVLSQGKKMTTLISSTSTTTKRSLSSSSSSSMNTAADTASTSTSTSTIEPEKEETTKEYHGLFRLLTDQERECLQEQRNITKLAQTLAFKVGNSMIVVTDGKSKQQQQQQQMLPSQFKQQSKSSSLLEELSTFSVVIAGEFNAGKSTLINALLGTKLLESGALPTTDVITIVSHSSNEKVLEMTNKNKKNNNNNNINKNNNNDIPLGVAVYTSSLPLLQDLTLVDTPGTNSTWMDHTERTLNLLPAADLIMFLTSADRPFSESEKRLLSQIQKFRKHIVVIVNKMDILDASGGDHGKEQKQAIVDFVTDHASELLGARPIVIPVSSRDALSAKLMYQQQQPTETTETATTFNDNNNYNNSPQQQSKVWQRSNFEALETFLKTTLTTQAKIKSKLLSPIGVAEGTILQCLETLQEQRNELESDIATLNILQSQFDGWKRELSSDLNQSRQTMTELLREEGQRCDLLLERMNFFQFHAWTIMNPNHRLQQEWEDTKRQVSSSSSSSSSSFAYRQKDLKTDLLEQVQETADSIATRGRAQGQAVIEYLGKRPAMKNQSLVGSVTAASRFEDTRKLLGERLSFAVIDCLKSGSGGGSSTSSSSNNNNNGVGDDNNNDIETIEKIRLFGSLRQIALLSTMFQTGALGMLVLSTTMAHTIIDPIEGMIAVSSCMLSGGATYVAGTSIVAKSYRTQWAQRADALNKALDVICTKELERVNRKILDGVAPYTRFVESEQERIEKLREECDDVIAGARSLRNKINKLR